MLLQCPPDPPLGLVRMLQYDDLGPADLQRGPRNERTPTDAGGAAAEVTNAPPSTAAFCQLLGVGHLEVRRDDIGKSSGTVNPVLHYFLHFTVSCSVSNNLETVSLFSG